MKMLSPEDLELLHRQGLASDIRNKLSSSNMLVYLVLEYFENKDLTEERRVAYRDLIKTEAEKVRDYTEHIIATLENTLSLPDEEIPNLVRGKRRN